MKKERFGTVDGREVFLYTLENSRGMKAVVSDFGALIVRLYAPDHMGNCQDVALGYETLEEYRVNGCFFGAVIAPNANRIGGAQYTLNGVTYTLDANDGANNLHSHKELGSHKRVWDAAEKDGGILFTLEIKDGEMGFGGNKKLSVLYQVTEDNGLRITYDGDSDRDTVINITNHCYFNLDGQGAGTIEGHEVQMFASAYTPADAASIPYGDVLRTEGTPMDFTQPHTIGERIGEAFEQLKLAGGYDHNWVLNHYDGSVRRVAVVHNSDKTRTMEVYTDLPGMQFYTGNFLEPEQGKDGKTYDFRGGFAMETQFFPDTPNKPQFPSSVFGPKRHYHTVTEYRFG